MPRNAYKFDAEVRSDGTIELSIPLPPRSKVEVVVITQNMDDFSDLIKAATANTDFRDNPIDDKEWNIHDESQGAAPPGGK